MVYFQPLAPSDASGHAQTCTARPHHCRAIIACKICFGPGASVRAAGLALDRPFWLDVCVIFSGSLLTRMQAAVRQTTIPAAPLCVAWREVLGTIRGNKEDLLIPPGTMHAWLARSLGLVLPECTPMSGNQGASCLWSGDVARCSPAAGQGAGAGV